MGGGVGDVGAGKEGAQKSVRLHNSIIQQGLPKG